MSTEQSTSGLRSAILTGWLIAGTADITAASIQTLIYGRNPLTMLQYVASGVFGQESFSGGLLYSFFGLVFHYIIALGWTLLFFTLYPRVSVMSKSVVATAFVYGLLVWTIMNRVVLPMSNVAQGPFNLSRAVIAWLVLVVAIGLPLALVAKRYLPSQTPRN